MLSDAWSMPISADQLGSRPVIRTGATALRHSFCPLSSLDLVDRTASACATIEREASVVAHAGRSTLGCRNGHGQRPGENPAATTATTAVTTERRSCRLLYCIVSVMRHARISNTI